jgi:hypothetical protein
MARQVQLLELEFGLDPTIPGKNLLIASVEASFNSNG